MRFQICILDIRWCDTESKDMWKRMTQNTKTWPRDLKMFWYQPEMRKGGNELRDLTTIGQWATAYCRLLFYHFQFKWHQSPDPVWNLVTLRFRISHLDLNYSGLKAHSVIPINIFFSFFLEPEVVWKNQMRDHTLSEQGTRTQWSQQQALQHLRLCFENNVKQYKPKDRVNTFHCKENSQLTTQYQQHPTFQAAPKSENAYQVCLLAWDTYEVHPSMPHN